MTRDRVPDRPGRVINPAIVADHPNHRRTHSVMRSCTCKILPAAEAAKFTNMESAVPFNWTSAPLRESFDESNRHDSARESMRRVEPTHTEPHWFRDTV